MVWAGHLPGKQLPPPNRPRARPGLGNNFPRPFLLKCHCCRQFSTSLFSAQVHHDVLRFEQLRNATCIYMNGL